MVKVNTSDFLKATDLNGETTVEFVDEGKYVVSPFKDQAGNTKQNFNITVRIGEDEKTWTMNKTSQRNIVGVYGDESSAWINKYAKLKTIEMLVGKDIKNVIIGEPVENTNALAPEGWPEE